MLAVGKPGSLRARLGSAHAAGCQGGPGLGQHVAPQGQWGGSASKLAAYALWAAAARSEHHRGSRDAPGEDGHAARRVTGVDPKCRSEVWIRNIDPRTRATAILDIRNDSSAALFRAPQSVLVRRAWA